MLEDAPSTARSDILGIWLGDVGIHSTEVALSGELAPASFLGWRHGGSGSWEVGLAMHLFVDLACAMHVYACPGGARASSILLKDPRDENAADIWLCNAGVLNISHFVGENLPEVPRHVGDASEARTPVASPPSVEPRLSMVESSERKSQHIVLEQVGPKVPTRFISWKPGG